MCTLLNSFIKFRGVQKAGQTERVKRERWLHLQYLFLASDRNMFIQLSARLADN